MKCHTVRPSKCLFNIYLHFLLGRYPFRNSARAVYPYRGYSSLFGCLFSDCSSTITGYIASNEKDADRTDCGVFLGAVPAFV
jgi:hypothetical protein